MGITALVAATLPHYRLAFRWAWPAYALSLALLVAVFYFPAVNGAHRWIRLGPVGVQPSELARLALIVVLARHLTIAPRDGARTAWAVPLALTLPPLLLVLREPNLGTALLMLPVVTALLVAAGLPVRYLLRLGLVGVLVAPLVISQMSREQRSRLTGLWQQTGPSEAPTSDGYQLHQAKMMLAAGGVWGTWLVPPALPAGAPHLLDGQPLDGRAVALPEDHTDFIFAVVGERWGWPGCGLVLLAIVLLVHQAARIAAATREPFGRLLVVGVVTQFGVQAMVNLAMAVGLLPIVGLSLPLVSYGGSGLVTQCAAWGLVINVALRPGYELGRGVG